MAPVVAGSRGKKTLGVLPPGENILKGRILADIGPFLRQIGIAIFAHPAGARLQLAVALHIEKRDGAEDRIEQFRPPGESRADQ